MVDTFFPPAQYGHSQAFRGGNERRRLRGANAPVMGAPSPAVPPRRVMSVSPTNIGGSQRAIPPLPTAGNFSIPPQNVGGPPSPPTMGQSEERRYPPPPAMPYTLPVSEQPPHLATAKSTSAIAPSVPRTPLPLPQLSESTSPPIPPITRDTSTALGRAGSMPISHWGPEEHQVVDQAIADSNPRAFAAMRKMEARGAAAQQSLARNTGPNGYGGVGARPTYDSQYVRDAVAANQRQDMLNNLSASDRKQLRLGAGGPVPAPVAPSAPKPSIGKNSDGQLVAYLPRMGTDGSLENARFVEGRRTPYGSMPYRTANGGLGLIGKDVDQSLRGEALERAGSQAENARVAKRTEEGGGKSAAGQYAERQQADRILNAVARYGLKDSLPAVQRAKETNKFYSQLDDARRQVRAAKTPLTSVSGGREQGLEKKNMARDKFLETSVGKAVNRYMDSGDAIGLNRYLQQNLKDLSQQELEGIANVVSLHEKPLGRLTIGPWGHNAAVDDINRTLGLNPKQQSQPTPNAPRVTPTPNAPRVGPTPVSQPTSRRGTPVNPIPLHEALPAFFPDPNTRTRTTGRQ